MLKPKPIAPDTERPTVDEAYTTADLAGAGGDLLLASGMSKAIAGGVLLRLMSEWDTRARPRLRNGGDPRALASALRSLPGALTQVQAMAVYRGVSAAAAPEVLLWWLAPQCPTCHGHGRPRIPGTLALSLRRCQTCSGSKSRPIPYGAAGKSLLAAMDEAINDWRSLTGMKLRQVAPQRG